MFSERVGSLAESIAAGHYFKIYSSQRYRMYIKESINASKLLNEESKKDCGHNYQVLTSREDQGDDQLWHLSQVEGTKYFYIRCKGRHAIKATLFNSG